MPWLTPDEESESVTVWRSLAIPQEYLHIVSGALLKLAEIWNWEQFGDITPAQAVDTMKAMIETYYEDNPMIGVCLPYATETIPANMLPCDGGSYARADYTALYAVLDTAYIDDADTFHTPNYVDRFPRGTSGNQGVTGGSDTHTLTVQEIPSHSHTIPYETCFPMGEIPEVCAVGGLLTQQTGLTGGGEAHNNIPAYLGQPWGIIFR